MTEENEKRYKIQEQTTMGLGDVEDGLNLTKDECKVLYKRLQESGVSADDFRIVRVK